MLDDDDIPNEAPKSPVIDLPDRKAGASHLKTTTEITATQATTTSSLVRNVRSHPLITYSSSFLRQSLST